jgi:hypothetical protein
MIRDGSDIAVTVAMDRTAGNLIRDQAVRQVDVGIDDGRTITSAQRRKAYAMLRDIAFYTGYSIEDAKQVMKVEHMLRTGDSAWFSLSTCSVTTAREFINTLMEYALKNGIILAERGIDRTDDIDTYLIQCIRYRRCCLCGRPADIHHIDTIGMGNDRNRVDDSDKEIVALCREHHMAAHTQGWSDFSKIHHIYGVRRWRTSEVDDNDLPTSANDKFTGRRKSG